MKEHGFEDFWTAWPKSIRKTGKAVCRQKWVKMLCWTQAETIIAHVKYMATTPDWKKNNGEYIPMPATYLNQMRWDGAEFEPVKEVKATDKDPVLLQIEAHQGAPMPAHIREKLAQIRRSH